jgi:H+/Cl- antiporter ClcA
MFLWVCRYFLGAAWAAGMDISSGMFVPMLLIGAVLGRVVGLLIVDLVPVDATDNWWLPAEDAQWKWIDPGVFAVVGAAAFMGGVTRLTVALAAIMMEVRAPILPFSPSFVLLGVPLLFSALSCCDRCICGLLYGRTACPVS